MNEDLHNIDDLFRSIIEPHEEEPKPETWHNIKSMLNVQQAQIYKRKITAILKVAAVLVLVLLPYALYDILNLTTKNKSKHPFSQGNTINEQKNYPGKKMDDTKTRDITAETKKQAGRQDKTKDITTLTNNPSNRFLTLKNKYVPSGIISDTLVALNHVNTHDTLFRYRLKQWVMEDKPALLSVIGKDSTLSLMISENKKNDSLTAGVSNQKDLNTKASAKKGNNSFKPYFSLTGFSAGEKARYRLKDNSSRYPVSLPYDDKVHIQNREKHEPSFAAGIAGIYQFKRRLAVQAGLMYYASGIVIEPHQVFATQQSDGTIAYKYVTSSGNAVIYPSGAPPNIGDSLFVFNAEDNLKYMALPVLIKYSASFKNFSISPLMGLSANFLLASELETEINDAVHTEINTPLEGVKKFYIDLMVNTAIEYKINKRFVLYTQPYVRYALTPLNSAQNTVRTYPYSFGLGLGITYKF